MSDALYDAVSYGMRYWFLILIALMLFTLIVVSVREYRQRKSVMGIVGQYIGYIEIVDADESAIGARVGLMKENTIGSSKRADIIIEDETVAKLHARIYVRNGALVLVPADRDTKINGRIAMRPHEIFSGDTVSFGAVTGRIYIKEDNHDA